MRYSWMSCLFVLGCVDPPKTGGAIGDSDTGSDEQTDQDNDGYLPPADCDDTDPAINPGVDEFWYDGVDSDCDNRSDYDADRDGYDSELYDGDDCDDMDASFNPAVEDTWYDGVDSNCDDWSDYDADQDGHDAEEYDGDDCDDTDPTVSPSAAETWYDGVDSNCDDWSDYDADQDGHDAEEHSGEDCEDLDPETSPDAPERCLDQHDNNCDEIVDHCTLDESDWVLLGAYSGYSHGAGFDVAGVGDINGDALADFTVLEPSGGGLGFVYIVEGAESLGESAATIRGDENWVLSDGSVAGAGDFNGDGYDDLLVGGAEAYLFYGAPSFSSTTVDAADVLIDFSADIQDVSGGSDVNGDGYDDIIIGVPNGSAGIGYSGLVYLYLGATSPAPTVSGDAALVWAGASYGDNAGRRVALLGDTNADGFDDLLIGATGESSVGEAGGAAYLVYGAASLTDSDLGDAGLRWTAEAAGDQAGYGLADAGDVDNDGYDDLLIAAPWNTTDEQEAGAVYLFLGGAGLTGGSLASADAIYLGPGVYDQVGQATSSAGDLNQDGYSDFLIGAYQEDTVYVVYGSASPTSLTLNAADAVLTGSGSFGRAVSGPGDVNGDGVDDVLVGADSYNGAFLWFGG